MVKKISLIGILWEVTQGSDREEQEAGLSRRVGGQEVLLLLLISAELIVILLYHKYNKQDRLSIGSFAFLQLDEKNILSSDALRCPPYRNETYRDRLTFSLTFVREICMFRPIVLLCELFNHGRSGARWVRYGRQAMLIGDRNPICE